MKVESYILFSDVEFLAYLYAKRSMPIRKEKDKDDALKLNENTQQSKVLEEKKF